MTILLCNCSEKQSKYGLLTDLEVNSEYTLNDIEDALIKHPSSIDLKIQKLKWFKKNDWQIKDEGFIEDILKNDQYNQYAYELIIEYYLADGEIESANWVATMAENEGINSASFYKLKSSLYSLRGEYTKSIDYINKAILLDKSNHEFYRSKGKIYLNLGDTISAIKFMKLGLDNLGNDYDLLYEISDLYERTSQYVKAEKLITTAMVVAPDIEKLRILYAEILLNQNKVEKAKHALRQSFFENSVNVQSALRLSDILMKEYLYDSVIQISNQVLTADSTNIYALQNTARAYDRKGFYSSSIANYSLILELDSLFENAREEMEKVISKRAYLQKLKERKAAMPVFDLVTPKRKIN